MEEAINSKPEERTLGMITDVGRVREIDEDSIITIDISIGTDSGMKRFKLLAVADGMGGHARGEEASKLALSTIAKTVISRLVLNAELTPAELLRKGVENANRTLLEHMERHHDTIGMGTTVVCALVADSDVYVANIGDSRAYAISKEEIRRVTKDHSYVQELVDGGLITDDEARSHPKKNIITKAIGVTPRVDPDTMRFKLGSDEFLLLCCDGVTAHLTDEDIHKTVIDCVEPQLICKKIVGQANENGGSDNISLVILSNIRDRCKPEDRVTGCDASLPS